jgi:hypothetical protein
MHLVLILLTTACYLSLSLSLSICSGNTKLAGRTNPRKEMGLDLWTGCVGSAAQQPCPRPRALRSSGGNRRRPCTQCPCWCCPGPALEGTWTSVRTSAIGDWNFSGEDLKGWISERGEVVAALLDGGHRPSSGSASTPVGGGASTCAVSSCSVGRRDLHGRAVCERMRGAVYGIGTWAGWVKRTVGYFQILWGGKTKITRDYVWERGGRGRNGRPTYLRTYLRSLVY